MQGWDKWRMTWGIRSANCNRNSLSWRSWWRRSRSLKGTCHDHYNKTTRRWMRRTRRSLGSWWNTRRCASRRWRVSQRRRKRCTMSTTSGRRGSWWKGPRSQIKESKSVLFSDPSFLFISWPLIDIVFYSYSLSILLISKPN